MAESVIGLFKTEVIRRLGPWKSVEDVEFATRGGPEPRMLASDES